MKNKLYGEEGTFRPFTLVRPEDGRFCRFEATADADLVFVRFRDRAGKVHEETLDTQEAINQICVMLVEDFAVTHDMDSGGPTRDLLEVAEGFGPTSPCLYLN